jgi:hypothetical protein
MAIEDDDIRDREIWTVVAMTCMPNHLRKFGFVMEHIDFPKGLICAQGRTDYHSPSFPGALQSRQDADQASTTGRLHHHLAILP